MLNNAGTPEWWLPNEDFVERAANLIHDTYFCRIATRVMRKQLQDEAFYGMGWEKGPGDIAGQRPKDERGENFGIHRAVSDFGPEEIAYVASMNRAQLHEYCGEAERPIVHYLVKA